MREDNKIVFTGPVGAGKTTAISALSDIAIISTDAQASDMTLNRKPQTTVAMDYGIMKLDSNTKVHLYGTPGQERFDFMWDILTVGGLGLVVMLDNTRPNPFKDLAFFLHSFKDYVCNVPVVIGITKVDIKDTPAVYDYSDHLEEATRGFSLFNRIPPVFEIDGRNKEDLKLLTMALLYSIDPGIG
jgi:small GTP-binding protein